MAQDEQERCDGHRQEQKDTARFTLEGTHSMISCVSESHAVAAMSGKNCAACDCNHSQGKKDAAIKCSVC